MAVAVVLTIIDSNVSTSCNGPNDCNGCSGCNGCNAMVILTVMVIMAVMAINAILPFFTSLDCLKGVESWPRQVFELELLSHLKTDGHE